MGSNGPQLLWSGQGDVIADLVFVHGLRGDPILTWSKDLVCWPRDFLKDDFPNVRIISWGYDSRVINVTQSASHASIFMHSENLLADISGLRRVQNVASRPIFFLCHSLGGLVVKEALIRSSEFLHNSQNLRLGSIYAKTKGVIFFGTPHRGSGKTALAELVSKAAKIAFQNPNDKLIEALSQDSQVLEHQRKSFSSISKNLPMVCISEEKPVSIGLIVPEHSATIDGFHVTTGSIPANHSDMCKFQNREEIGYTRTLGYLCDLLDTLGGQGSTWWDHNDVEHVYNSLEFPRMDERWEGIDDSYGRTFQWILPKSTGQEEILLASPDGSSIMESHAASAPSIGPHVLGNSPLNHGQVVSAFSFAKWLEAEDAPIFWISGKAASGKSTLMKHIDQRTELKPLLSGQYAKGSNNLVMASFFFYDQGKSTLQMSREGLLRALLLQLLKSKQTLWNHVFDSKCRTVFKDYKGRARTFEERVAKPVVEWSWTELHDAFRAFALRKPEDLKVFLLIDGLDEFRLLDGFGDYMEYEDNEDSAQVRRNIAAHRSITKFLVDLSTCGGFKLCLSSRPLQVFEDAFSDFPNFKLQDLTLRDIQFYVVDRLVSHPRSLALLRREPERTKAIILEISSKASGVFLWVRLVIDILLDALDAGDSISELEENIEKIPLGLRGPQGLYARMLATVLPQYREEGLALFCRVFAARGHLTLLALSFTQESLEYTLNCATRRIREEDVQFRTDEMKRRLQSRCGGLLESIRNPYRARLLSSAEHEAFIGRVAWQVRPHFGLDPAVNFVHRTAVEYLQSSGHVHGVNLLSRMDDKVYVQLMVSNLLRIKWIGRTAHVWEIWDAVKDAVLSARRIEIGAGYSPTNLLDEIGAVSRNVWSQGMSAGRPEDYNNDPGYGHEVRNTREKKGVPVRKIHYVSSIWGPLYGCQHGDDILSFAVQGNLVLYLEEKIQQYGFDSLNRRGRPLLAYAVLPRGDRSPFEDPLSSDDLRLARYSSSQVIKLLIRHGADPNEIYNGQTVWHTALRSELIRWNPDDDDNESMKEMFCLQSRDWAAVMTLLVENGADVFHSMPETSSTPLMYLFPVWCTFASRSEPIKELVSAIIRRIVGGNIFARQLRKITPETSLSIQEAELRKFLGLPSSNRTQTDARQRGASRSGDSYPETTFDMSPTEDQTRIQEDFQPSTNHESRKIKQRITKIVTKFSVSGRTRH